MSTVDNCVGVADIPAISAFDACGHEIIVSIEYPYGVLNQNGGEIELPSGSNIITYIVSDECYNSSSCQFNVDVDDMREPVAICEPNTVVSIELDGRAEVFASSFDDGSWDECGIQDFQVRRMDTLCLAIDTSFNSSVSFCCEDVGNEVMVIFRVTDNAGNYNECMVRVNVQDKIPAILSCPDDFTVECGIGFDLANLSISFGDVNVIDNCPDIQNVYEIVDSDINQCGIGSIIRKFEIRDLNGGIESSCVQYIEVRNSTPFTEADITWPFDYDIQNGCSVSDLNPSNLPEEFGYPSFINNDDECTLLGFDYEDQFFESLSGNGQCAYIERTWTIINWCSQINGQFESWTITNPQILTLNNSIAPVLDDIESMIFETQNIDCVHGDVFI